MSAAKIKELKDGLLPMGFEITDKVAKDALFFSRNKINDQAFSYAIKRATPISSDSHKSRPLTEELRAWSAAYRSPPRPLSPPSQAGPSSLGMLTDRDLSMLSEEEQLRRALEESEAFLKSDKTTGKHKEHAEVLPFMQWINENFKKGANIVENADAVARRTHQREKLLKIFGENNWDVIDPVGDGFCTIYAAFIDQGLVYPSGKDELINLIIKGMQKYFQVRDDLISKGIHPPRRMNDDVLIQISDDDILFVNKDSIKDVAEMTRRLQPLSGLGNTPVELLHFLPYALNRNYLMLINDPNARKVEDRYNLLFFPCYSDFFKIEGTDNVIYPYEDSTTILYNNGHTFLFHNAELAVKLDTINRLKRDPTLWARVMTGGKLLKKIKKTIKTKKTKKSKKTKKTKTKKTRKHKITKKRKMTKKR